MLSVPDVLAIVALVLGAMEVIRSRAQNLVAWAVCLLALALLWSVLKL